MIFKLRVILETEQDVFRDIEISSSSNLLELHKTIKSAFDLEGEELASFYLSNDEWFQGSEIPLEDMSEEGGVETMEAITLDQVVPKQGDKMIYVYDFLSLWTFYVEVVEIDVVSMNKDFPTVVFEYGQRPEEAPEKELQIDIDIDGEFDDEEDDDFLEFGEDYNGSGW